MEIQRYRAIINEAGETAQVITVADHQRVVAEYQDVLGEWKAQHDRINLIGGCDCQLGKLTDALLGKG